MWYDEGTVSLVQGSVTVTGVGTDFVSNTRSADMFVGPDGRIYEVVNYTNETTLAIKPAYIGPTISNTPDFFVIPIQGYTKIAADRLNRISLGMVSIEEDVASATLSATNAALSATAANASKVAAKTSETNSKTSETNAKTSETNAGGSATAAAGSASAALTSRNQAQTARDEAVAAAGTVTGTIAHRGNWSAAGGALPATPTESSIWRVSVGGTVGGVVYRVGDDLIYSKAINLFYRSSNYMPDVIAELGAVTPGAFGKGMLAATTKEAAQNYLTLVPTQSADDTNAGRLLKVGDYGLASAITITDANAATLNGATYRLAGPYANGPTAGPYIIRTLVYDAEITQVAYAEGGTAPVQYMRQYRAGWQGWVKTGSAKMAGEDPLGYLGNIDDVSSIPFGFVTVAASAAGTKPPGKTYGFLQTIGQTPGPASATRQFWSDFDGAIGTKTTWVRDKYGNNGFGNWRLIYDQNSVVGTVANPGAVGAGAIIERGSNGNGEFIKYLDGTMIAWRRVGAGTGTAYALGPAGFWAGDAFGGSTPFTFSAIPSVVCAMIPNTGNPTLCIASCFAPPSVSSFGAWRAVAVDQITLSNGVIVNLVATGRWY